MKGIIYLLILSLVFVAPIQKVDVAELLPIRAVALYVDGERIVLETDTGYKGSGTTVQGALDSLKKAAPAVVYLDTAEYLLVAPGTEPLLGELTDVLRSSVEVSISDGKDRVAEVAEYLDVHGKTTKLHQWWTK